MQADLGVVAPTDPTDRFWDPAQGGGALLDLGVYVVSFAQQILGVPERVVAHGSLAETGVEREATLLLGYDDGRSATLRGLAAQPHARSGQDLRHAGVDRRAAPVPPPARLRAAPHGF